MRIITGMHRSGTSLLARLFYESGADMGDVRNFVGADKWNPDGYYEQPDIHAVNMPLINGAFWKFSYFKLPSTETIINRASRRSIQIKQTVSKYHKKVVKETRFCLTLPVWLKYGADIDKVIVCLRDPIQIARSIRRRNFITINYALTLWHIHYTRLLENARGLPLWFVYYNNLLDEKLLIKEMKYAFSFFDYNLTDDELRILRKKCIKPNMNHYPDVIKSYPTKIETLWHELLDRHANQFNKN